MKEQTITKILFWLAFSSFLAGSIPHVAYVFHYYESGNNDTIGWCISYALAGSIDVLVMWLSFTQSKGKMTDKTIIWFFILSLALLSWLCNWLYDMAHNTSMTSTSIWTQTVLGSQYTYAQITAIIVSAIPLFILAYTFMISKVASSNMTANELANAASELKAKQEQLKRINELKRQAKAEKGNALVNGIVAFKRDWKQVIAPVQETPIEETPVQPEKKEHDTDKLKATPALEAVLEELDSQDTQEIPTMVPAEIKEFLEQVNNTK